MKKPIFRKNLIYAEYLECDDQAKKIARHFVMKKRITQYLLLVHSIILKKFQIKLLKLGQKY